MPVISRRFRTRAESVLTLEPLGMPIALTKLAEMGMQAGPVLSPVAAG
jgi:hypothetical protein